MSQNGMSSSLLSPVKSPPQAGRDVVFLCLSCVQAEGSTQTALNLPPHFLKKDTEDLKLLTQS